MTRTTISLRPTPGRRSVAVEPGSVESYVMDNGTIRLTWGGLGKGFQPTKLEHLASGATENFSAFPFWKLTTQTDIGGVETVTGPVEATSARVVVTRTSHTEWKITWTTASGVQVTTKVALSGNVVTFSWTDPKSNISDESFRDFYGPMAYVKRPTTSVDTSTYRLVMPIWGGGIVNNPNGNAFNVPANPDMEDVPVIQYDCPGLLSLDLLALYERGSKHFFLISGADAAGTGKGWVIGYKDADRSTLIGPRHYVAGRTNNTWAPDYQIRWTIGTAAVENAEWWYAIKSFKDWIATLRPRPTWWPTAGLPDAEPLVRDEILCTLAHFPNPPSDNEPNPDDNLSLHASAAAGASLVQVTDPSFTTAPDLTNALSLVVPAYGMTATHRITSAVDKGAYWDIEIRPPLAEALTKGTHTVDIVADYTELPNYVSDVDGLFKDYCTFLGISKEQLLGFYYRWHGSGDVRASDTERMGFPRWQNRTGAPRAHQVTLRTARSGGIRSICYTYMVQYEDAADQAFRRGGAADRLIQRDTTPKYIIGKLNFAGPDEVVDLRNRRTRDSIVTRWAQAIQSHLPMGFYLDAHIDPTVRPSYNQNLTDAEVADTAAMFKAALDLAREVKRSAKGQEPHYLTDETGKVLLDELTRPLCDPPPSLEFLTDESGNRLTSPETVKLADEMSRVLQDEAGNRLVGPNEQCRLLGNEPGTPLRLEDEKGNALTDENGDRLTIGENVVWDPSFLVTSEAVGQHSVAAFDLLGSFGAGASADLAAVGVAAMHDIWDGVFGGRQLNHLLAGHSLLVSAYPTDIADLNAEEKNGYTIARFHAGQILGIVSSTPGSGTLSDQPFVRGTPSTGSGYTTNEKRMNDAFKHLVRWDMIEKVRRYRREGEAQHPVYGYGLALESYEKAGDFADFFKDPGYIAASVRSHASGYNGRLMLLVSNRSMTVSKAATFVLDSSIYPELSSASEVYEIDHSTGEETLLSGILSGGKATFALTVGAGLTRAFEVR